MFTITLPPLLEDASVGRDLAASLPDEGAAHVEIDARLLALADHGFVADPGSVQDLKAVADPSLVADAGVVVDDFDGLQIAEAIAEGGETAKKTAAEVDK